jgi:hypothetical protein
MVGGTSSNGNTHFHQAHIHATDGDTIARRYEVLHLPKKVDSRMTAAGT